ncbi:hypothetical protein G5I_09440 [Acromyrmex echinatior]|uniref:Uncharacterized protein n=1 Tax=Acromyrmex echinatior TaxID=103372 RepID=F4WU83_ACREC|nr:hypothetical protein G5I_09440 [Acromyrmex echinatior]
MRIKNKSLFIAFKDKNLLDRWTSNLSQLKKPLTEYCFVYARWSHSYSACGNK